MLKSLRTRSFTRRAIAVVLGVFAPIALAHYFGFVELANQQPIVLASSPPVTSAPVTTVSSRDWVCTTATNVVQGAPATTRTAAFETDCGTRAQDGQARYIAERTVSRTTTTTTVDQTTLIRVAQAFGGTTIRVADAHAQMVAVAGGGAPPGGGGGGSPGYDADDVVSGLPCTLTQPTAPTITGSATVNTGTFDGEISNGDRLTLQAGAYGNKTITADDIELILQDGATFGVLTISTSNRAILRCENARACGITEFDFNSGASDWVMNGIEIAGTQNEFYGDRIVIVNSDVEMTQYSVYADGADNIIVGNSNLKSTLGTFPTVRLMNGVHSAFADVRIWNEGPQTAYRVHGDSIQSDDHCLERYQIEDGTIQLSADGDANGIYVGLADVFIRNGALYFFGGGANMSVGVGAARPTGLVLTGNDGYGMDWPDQSQVPGSTINNNTESAYEAPPAWDFL